MDNTAFIDQELIPEYELIKKILNGDKDLYAVIVRRFNQRLYRVGMSILNNDSQVEDAMQTAYIKAYENLGKFAFRSGFGTWLTRIMINECIQRTKRNSRWINLTENVLEFKQNEADLIEQKSPENKMLNTELKSIIETAVRNLPEKYRVVFVLREIENLNVAETKECLDISEENVKVRLNRAKSMLKKSLSAIYNREDILQFHLLRCDRMVEAVLKKIHQLAVLK